MSSMVDRWATLDPAEAYAQIQAYIDGAHRQQLLTSPNGTVFAISVDDTGKLVSTPVAPGLPAITFSPIVLNGTISAANPAGTSSGVFVMMGLALPMQSVVATEAFIVATGVIANSANNGQSEVALFIGTWPAPANGGAPAGQQVGQSVSFKSASGSGALTPFALTGLCPIVLGTPYWVDLGLRASGGVATLTNVDAIALGLP